MALYPKDSTDRLYVSKTLEEEESSAWKIAYIHQFKDS